MENDYYDKFPAILKNALKNETVIFPKHIEYKYKSLYVYRGVKITANKQNIDESDFLSQIEITVKFPWAAARNIDKTNIEFYSCSCYTNLALMEKITHFPYKNKAIAQGEINDKLGAKDYNKKNNTY